jgi:putative membrane protein
MFLWKTSKGQKIFKTDAAFANRSASLAANQGLYNGFLAAGLFWSLSISDKAHSMELKVFFLSIYKAY